MQMGVWVLEATTEAQFSFYSENGPCVCLPPTSAVGLLLTASPEHQGNRSRGEKRVRSSNSNLRSIGQRVEYDEGHLTFSISVWTDDSKNWEFTRFERMTVRSFWDFIL